MVPLMKAALAMKPKTVGLAPPCQEVILARRARSIFRHAA